MVYVYLVNQTGISTPPNLVRLDLPLRSKLLANPIHFAAIILFSSNMTTLNVGLLFGLVHHRIARVSLGYGMLLETQESKVLLAYAYSFAIGYESWIR